MAEGREFGREGSSGRAESVEDGLRKEGSVEGGSGGGMEVVEGREWWCEKVWTKGVWELARECGR